VVASPQTPPLQRAPPGPVQVWALAAAAVVATVGTVLLATRSDSLPGEQPLSPIVTALLMDWVALTFVGAGLVAWSRRPGSRFGPLMVGAGFCAWLSALDWSNAVLPHTIGVFVDLLVVALFLHVYLAYPTGRLSRQPERGLVLAGYGMALIPQATTMLLGNEPDTLLEVVSEPAIADAVQAVQIYALVVLCLAAVTVLIVRRVQGGTRRRPVTLLIDAFGIGLLMLAVMFVAAMAQSSLLGPIRFVTFAVLGLAPVAFLLGLLDARLARSSVGDLLVQLRASSVADLRELLSVALRDPSLTVAYWLPEFGSWADHTGRLVPAPDEVPGRGTALIQRGGEPVAALLFDPDLEEERELIRAVTAAAGIALENDRLQVELLARVQELKQSRIRMLDAGQRERQRLERNLHDGAQQRLVAVSLELGLLAARLGPDTAAGDRLKLARSEIATSLEELRDVARGIHPAVLSAHGLTVALESLAARSPVPLDLHVATGGRLPAPVETAAYYVVCEGLTNIGKHAHASTAGVDVSAADGLVAVEIVDDGMGGADPERGSGLRGLADRVESLGGRLQVWTPPGGGTRVRAELPCG
jgi:signal transduction histidine kinase